MSEIKLKFKCTNKSVPVKGEVAEITMEASTTGSKENKQFFHGGANGFIALNSVNQKASESIQEGKDYELIISPIN